jgi:FlaA1/EpsC-like NDP-sugar epimerase
MVEFIRTRKKLLFTLGDILAVLLANVLAVMLRFDFDLSVIASPGHRHVELVILDLILTPVVFWHAGLYQGYWRYAGLDDLLRLARAVGIKTIALIVVVYALDLSGLSRAVVIISTMLLLLLTGLLRLAPRFHFEFFSTRRKGAGKRALIVGAGDTGEALLRELKKAPHLDYNPVGFIDDDPEKAGVKIHGVPVLGDRHALEGLIEEFGVRELIIAIPGASGRDLREMFEICRRTGVRFKTVPTRGELARGAARLSQIRPVDLEDLLGRAVVRLDQQPLRQGLSRRRVMVTGAAGSIGRELARQIAACDPDQLILLDRNETSLFHLEAELRQVHALQRLVFIVGDVLDRRRLEDVFRATDPQIIFHAAAYKHVPLMEQNPVEAIKNNVIATNRLSDIAASHGVERFIYVSTDKAVRPSSVMGASKKLGERLVQSLEGGATRFMAVRFGNVLGSDGSVIPTFRRQIAAGGPVTVTHPEATRYFMTIPEAVQLVLMAGVMGGGGETFLLKPDEDIKIVFTGLRPGEKLHEELRDGTETALPTSNEKIMILAGIEPLGEEEWRHLRSLEEAALEGRVDVCLSLLRMLVKDYSPAIAAPEPVLGPVPKVVEMSARRHLEPRA